MYILWNVDVFESANVSCDVKLGFNDKYRLNCNILRKHCYNIIRHVWLIVQFYKYANFKYLDIR